MKYDSLAAIAEKIKNPDLQVVSFDMFDTLVQRPIENCTDLYELLDHTFGQLTHAQISFRKLRMEAEAILRREMIRGIRTEEDVTLDEIYEELKHGFAISGELADCLKQKEIELEYDLCMVRRSGKWLYEQALAAGKRVIVISDMYLPGAVLETMLKKHGYDQLEQIFVSSDLRLRKTTGHLFSRVLEQLSLDASSVLHIGDNQESDVRIPAELGIRSVWLPSAMDAYQSRGCAHQVEKICGELTNWEAARQSVGIGCMRQMAADFYFDDPFRSFASESDYNRDPYFIGYAALGMEILALVRWLSEQLVRDEAKKMIFMARDGYLPMQVYERYRKLHPELPPAEYLPVSRRAVFAAMFRTATDLYDLPVDLNYQTPAKLLKLLSFCDGKVEQEEWEEDYLGFAPEETLNRSAFVQFVAAFIRDRYDSEKHRKAIERIAAYMKENSAAQVCDGAALFDMGYSGRIPAAILNATGVTANVYYFHTDSREHFRHEKKSGMKIRSFFDFNPYMESSIREYSYLEPAASCIGYTEELRPVYDIGPAEGYSEAAVAMQQGAIRFAEDYLGFFGAYEEEAGFRYHDAAMPFEAFIRYCTPYDRKIYEQVLIDDELWGGRRDIELKYLIESRLRKIPDYAKHEGETR